MDGFQVRSLLRTEKITIISKWSGFIAFLGHVPPELLLARSVSHITRSSIELYEQLRLKGVSLGVKTPPI